ncbi:MAG: ABC transporter permease [Methanospirillaceae archaeon]|nr:ABC transporter permease [Methanospirillaceae archaeon]
MIGDIFFSLSVRSVRLHFLRSLLAALGIVIGVVAISSMGILGTNMTLSITASLSENANELSVNPVSGTGGGGGMFGSQQSESDDDQCIDRDQVRDIRRIAIQDTVIPIYSESGETITIGDEETRCTIYGLKPEDVVAGIKISEGSYLKGSSGAIVGSELQERYSLHIGSRIKIGDPDEGTPHIVRVVGFAEEKGMSMALNPDNAIIVDAKLFVDWYGGEYEYDQVLIIVSDINTVTETGDAIEEQLNRKEETVSVRDSSGMLENVTSSLSTMTSFVTAIGAISLLVAATSIFNVMMMSVTERIKEIGILRSIGTKKREILKMILYEASILGLVGSIIGGIMSFVGGYLICMIMLSDTTYFWMPASLVNIANGVVVGIAICIFSGMYPAWRAANLDPIEALRSN